MSGRVLVVDDNADHRSLLADILEEDGFETREADNGSSALAIAGEWSPDIVLLDVVMPDMSGHEVCRRLRGMPGMADLPVIFISGKSDPSDRLAGLEVGAVDYIGKPFDMGEVRARVRGQMTLRNLNRSLRTANEQLLQRQYRIDEDLRAAAGIQRSLLPAQRPSVGALRTAWRFIPCETVGGDIFNIVRLDETHVAFFLIDVSGHGVPSAMVAVSVSRFMSSQAGLVLKTRSNRPPYYGLVRPSDVLKRLNGEFPFAQFEKYFTICYLVVNVASGEVVYSSAGHPPPLLARRTGEVEWLESAGPVIGALDGAEFPETRVFLLPGDRLVLYTDGVTDYADAKGRPFGGSALEREVTAATRETELERVCDRILRAVESHGAGTDPGDDMTLVTLEYTVETK